MSPLSGRHAFVTGASRGSGAAIAEHLAQAGAAVTKVSLHAGADIAACDVRSAEQIDRAVREAELRHGPIDILVNNAGIAGSAPFVRTDTAMMERMLDTNFKGPWYCSQRVLPGMLSRQWGKIINIASVAGLDGHAYISAYCSSKHALVGLTRALAAEVKDRNVTISAICPGYTQTDMLDESIGNIVRQTALSADQARAVLASTNADGRIVSPVDIASAVIDICISPSERFNGQIISIPN